MNTFMLYMALQVNQLREALKGAETFILSTLSVAALTILGLDAGLGVVDGWVEKLPILAILGIFLGGFSLIFKALLPDTKTALILLGVSQHKEILEVIDKVGKLTTDQVKNVKDVIFGGKD